MKNFTKKDWLLLSLASGLTLFGILYNEYVVKDDPAFHPKPLTDNEIKLFGNEQNTIVIYPIFTQFAYSENGFYDYYKEKCDTSCLTVSFKNDSIKPIFNMGANGYEYLSKLGYASVTDIDVDKNPQILEKYDKIILLHNEYMTQKEFDAVKNHKNVLYLYPNAMYAEVDVDYDMQTMKLVRGHGYPEASIDNGFDYVTNTQFEYDIKCVNYLWKSMPNGIQPTCFPEYFLTYDHSIFQTIKDFPQKIPNLVQDSQFQPNFCDRSGDCSERLIDHLNKKP